MTDEELENELRIIIRQIEKNTNTIVDYIDELREDSELTEIFKDISGETLDQMLTKQAESDENRKRESEEYYRNIKELMDKKGWYYTSIDEVMIIALSFGLTNLIAHVFIIIEPVTQVVRINVVIPAMTSDDNITEVKSLLSDLNYECRFGAFLCDNESGTISYYYAYCFFSQIFNAEVFENYLYSCLSPPDDNYELLSELCGNN